MNELIEAAIDSATSDYEGDALHKRKPVHAGDKTRKVFVRRLKNMLAELPEDMSVRELLEELE